MPPRKGPLDLSTSRRLHVVGVGGAGMSAIATVLAQMGHQVSGSDLKESRNIDRLRLVGVDVRIGHDRANVSNVTRRGDHVERDPGDERRGGSGDGCRCARDASRRGADRDRRDQAIDRRRRQPRQDDDVLDAGALPARRAGTRAFSSVATSTRSGRTRPTTAGNGWSSKPTRATERSWSWLPRRASSRTSSPTTLITTGVSRR